MHDVARLNATARPLDAIDALLIDRLQETLPLTDRPFADVGNELNLSEADVLERLRRLLAQGVLTRFGPLFQIEKGGGQFVLAALAVPKERFDAVAASVNALPEVAHNYRREHALNMWFVIAVDDPREVARVCEAIEQDTGLKVYAFPKEREFRVRLFLSAQAAQRPPETAKVAPCH